MRWKRDAGLSGRIFLTWALLLLVYLIFMGILWALGVHPGLIVLVAVILGLVQYFFSDKLVLMSTGAKIVGYDDAPALHQMIEGLCRVAELPKPRVAIMSSPMPNAFATGRGPHHAVVAVTDSIMQTLSREELEAVLAHELSHIKNRDMLTMTVAGFVAMIASIIMNNFLYVSMFGDREERGSWVVAGIVAAIVYVFSTMLMMALSRYREFAADRGAAYITGNPEALIYALEKISGRMAYIPSNVKVSAGGANAFYIIPAFSGKSVADLFSTHPTLERRIENLLKVRREIRGY